MSHTTVDINGATSEMLTSDIITELYYSKAWPNQHGFKVKKAE